MADTGRCQINDIVLSIPPESIQVDRRSFNYEWQTLRTRSSTKVKSGFSQIDIVMVCKFTDDAVSTPNKEIFNGFRKLRALVSQFRVTPFCYVENDFLRNSILAGDRSHNMALALKQMEISKTDESTNVITVTMSFAWFNYFPFSRDFTFKRDIFIGDEVKNPSNSAAWKLLYHAEQQRTNYRVVDQLNSKTRLTYNEFNSLLVQDYDRLKKEISSLETLRGELLSSGNNDVTGSVNNRIVEVINRELQSQIWAESLIEQIFGNQTSFGESTSEEDIRKGVLRILDSNLAQNTDINSKYGLILNTEWKPVVLNDGSIVKYKSEPGTRTNEGDKFDKSTTVLMKRKNSISLESHDIHIIGITISFENILATLPMIGHAFATFQHIGSIDARIILSMTTTSEDGVKKLSALYSAIEDQARRFRNVPAGQRNLIIDNDLVNMCGIEDTIPDSIKIDTVPGSPGTTSAVLVLTDNPINQNTAEKFASSSLSTAGDLRRKIAEILERNLKLIDNAFKNKNTDKVELRKLKDPEFGILPDLTNIPKTGLPFSIKAPGESAYYQYTGPKNDRNGLFRELCEDYGKELGKLLSSSFPLTRDLAINPLATLLEMGTDEHRGAEDFFLLKNEDVFGIEKIQEDILTAINPDLARNNFDKFKKQHPDVVILEPVEKRLQKTEAFFKTYNTIRDLKNFTGPLSEDQQNILGEATEKVETFKVDDNLTALLNTMFADWLTFANKFLDDILYKGNILLPEFKEVRDLMSEKSINSPGGAYPDFPLEQVVGLLQASKGSNMQHSFRRMKELYERSGLSLKNVNMSVLINPDFYFFNPQNDTVESIIPNTVMRTAAKAIIDARKDMQVEEGDWFKGVYKKYIVGEDKFNRTNEIIKESKETASYKALLGTKIGSDWETSLNDSLNSLYVMPNTLTGSIGPSLSEAANLSPIQKDGEETVGANSITVKASNPKTDLHNTRTNYSEQTQLASIPGASSVKHRFDTEDVLTGLPETEYIPKDSDPNKVPFIAWPTPSDTQRVVSYYGPRPPPKRTDGTEAQGASTDHKGVDISVNWNIRKTGRTSEGTVVSASADGKITNVVFSRRTNVSIEIAHSGGCKTRYRHLAVDAQTTQLLNIFQRKGPVNLNNATFDAAALDSATRDSLLTIVQGQSIGIIGPTVPGTTGPHLHFELLINGVYQDPYPYLTGEIYKSQGPLKSIEPQNESVLSKSVQQFEKDLRNGQGFSMMRAFPTFKLYFIESDMNERKRYSFDDFFSYSAVKDITVIKSRKIAADLCIIELTNISGVLSNRKFRNALDPTTPKASDGTEAQEENPIASLMLQPGIQIQLRLGYSNNPEELDVEFNGTISDVQFSETDDLVTIVCQSFATELVQTIHGEVKDFGGLFDGDGRTFKILEELMASPEVVHFGRWEQKDIGINNNRGLLTNRWRLIPAPQDDNIFAPMGQTRLGFIDAILSTKKYLMYQTTIWDVFQEMCLRHPSYIASAVPYEGKFGPRMTMFFGLPDQLYFARDSSFKEDQAISALKDVVKNGHQDDASAVAVEEIRDNSKDLDAQKLQDILDTDLSKKTASERDRWFQILSKAYALDRGSIRPFRSYHLLTSSMHIINNSLNASSHNVFNTVTLQYGEDEAKFKNETAELNFSNLETFTLRADEAIPDEEVIEMFAQYPNCVGYEMAKQYSVSLLFNALKEAYKGSLVVVGSPKIKPYDICYIFDEYTDMFGPIEVEQVIHRFSQETGFITEITPDLLVHVNQHSTLSTSDAMGLIAEHSIRSIGIPSLPPIVKVGAVAGAALAAPVLTLSNLAFAPIAAMVFNSSENSVGQSGSTTWLGMIGAFVFRKLITRTQLAHPFRYSPLVLNSRPMIGGLPNRHSDGTFIQKMGKWFKDSKEGVDLLLDDTMDRMNPSNWVGRLGEGDISTLFPGGS